MGYGAEVSDRTATHGADHALQAWGIQPRYGDVSGRWQEPAPAVAAALRRAMGAATDDPSEPPPPATPLRILRPGGEGPGTVDDLLDPVGEGRADLVTEDGDRLPMAPGQVLPRDLPLGYHHLESGDGTIAAHLIVSPGRVALDEELRTWGVVAQLYAARSTTSWGIGDLADLGRIIEWATSRGAGVVGLNPLHASTPAGPPLDSPYSPSSRRWRNPLYLAIENVPGADQLDDLDGLRAAGRALNDGSSIDRQAVWGLKRPALERLWDRFRTQSDARFDRYRDELGVDLLTWATFCALADHHGTGWRSWPLDHRRPGTAAVDRFVADHPSEIGFWAWLQWLLDGQLVASGAPEVAIADLAVGIDGDGADAWEWQDLLAPGMTIGAPPDLLGPQGQDWCLPPFVPSRLRNAGYQPLATTIRAGLRNARGLRIDHVMGLFRLFWIPEGLTGAEGAYVRFAGRELLDVVALESHRAGGLVVGEDLGTLEGTAREHLADAGVLSTRLLWFEGEPPSRWPHQSMAAITTHDLPTIAGMWTGTDLADRRAAGVHIDPGNHETMRDRLEDAAHAEDDTPVADVIVGAHRALAASPSMIVTATLDDAVGAEHRPNLPGTIDEHPNWRIPLPVPIDHLDGHPVAEAVADALGSSRR